MEEDIEHLKELKVELENMCITGPTSEDRLNTHRKSLAIENILNELERLQKENERLNKKIVDKEKEYNHFFDLSINRGVELNDSIPKQVIRDKIQEIENSGIWITEDCFFDGETDNLICQQEFKKYEMEEYIINLLRKLLGE